MTEKSLGNIDFSYIRYANCWEDAEVLIQGLKPESNSRILSIGSAGDNSFSLLSSSPELVTAIDINPAQTALIELKKAAIKNLDYQGTLGFLGFAEYSARIETFHKLKKGLSVNAHQYWSDNLKMIENGVIHQGKFEKYFQYFSRRVLPLIHQSKTAEKLMLNKSKTEQENFYRQSWNTWRWQLLFRIFFSRVVIGKFGRDKQFFNEVKEPVAKSIFKRVGKYLAGQYVFENEFLEYILFRNFKKNLPHYLRPENFEIIKINIDKLEIVTGSFGTYYTSNCNYSHLNLSDIFEYLSEDDYLRTVKLIKENSKMGTKLVYWNLLVPRRLSHTEPAAFRYKQEKSNELSAIDKGFFYSPVILDERR